MGLNIDCSRTVDGWCMESGWSSSCRPGCGAQRSSNRRLAVTRVQAQAFSSGASSEHGSP